MLAPPGAASRCCDPRLLRQVDLEGRAPSGGLLQRDVAAHLLGETLDDGKAQSGSPLRSSIARLQLSEAGERSLTLLGGDAGSVVDYANRCAVTPAGDDLDRTVRGVLEGIVDEVGDDAAEMIRVGLEKNARRHVEGHKLFGLRDVEDDVRDEGGEVDLTWLLRQRIVVDPRHHQEVLDHATQTVRLVASAVQQLLTGGADRGQLGAGQSRQRTDDGCQWRAQFVGDD